MQKLNIAVYRQRESNSMMAKSIREPSGCALKMLFNLITSICADMIISGRSSYLCETCWAAELRRNKVLIVLCRCPHLKVSLIRLKSAGELYGKPF